MEETPEEKAQREAAAVARAATGGGALGTVATPEDREAAGRLAVNVGDVVRNLPYGGVLTDVLGFDRKPSPATAPVTTPRVNVVDFRDGRTVTRLTGSPEEDLASGMNTNWAEQPIVQQENVSSTVPVSDAGTDQTPEGRQQAQLAMLRAQIMGMRAPSVGMNKYQIRGFEGQQGALGEQISAMNAEQPDIDAARAGMQQVGQQYIGGLEKLNAQRQGVNDARRGAMAEDERKLAAAENTFDASRALRGMGDSPVSTGVMSFAAGLVGALKGEAGDMSANQVLAEVDKAVERDVMNQKEQYSRMLQGQTTARSNFHDARQMGADDNEALAASTMASMDQHKRALQFAEQRVSGAREKASLKGAIYALDGQRGKLQMDLDLKNAAAQGSVNAAKMQALMLLKAGNAGMSLDDQIKQGNAYNAATKDDRWQTSSRSLQSIAEMRKIQSEIPLEKQAELWNTGVSKVIREALDKIAASPDSGTAIAAISKYIGAQFKSDMTNDQRKMLSFAQGMINNRLKDISGGSVTTGEQVRDLMSRNLDTFDGFNSWIDKSESEAMAGINSGLAVGKFNPDVARVMEATVAPWIETNKQYAKSLNDMSRVGQQYGNPK